MFSKKAPPPARLALPLQVFTHDYLIEGQLNAGLEEGLISPWLLRMGNPDADQIRSTLLLSAVRLSSIGPLAPPASPGPDFAVWLKNIVAVVPVDSSGQQAVSAWSQKSLRKHPRPGLFYIGALVIQGTAMVKDSHPESGLGFVVPILEATISSSAPGSSISGLRAAALLVGTERLSGYEPR
jgi:hypothetical protein